jgi:KDO2-lipid IV(A) lauroyltransferase
VKGNIAAYAYFAGWRIVRWLPERTAYHLAYAAADFLTKRNGKNVARLRSNLRRVKPDITSLDLDLLVFAAMRS